MTTSFYESRSHSRWERKYHVVFVSKYRNVVLHGKVREYLKTVFHELARQKGCEIIEGHMVQDHVHMIISIPPIIGVNSWEEEQKEADNLLPGQYLALKNIARTRALQFSKYVASVPISISVNNVSHSC